MPCTAGRQPISPSKPTTLRMKRKGEWPHVDALLAGVEVSGGLFVGVDGSDIFLLS